MSCGNLTLEGGTLANIAIIVVGFIAMRLVSKPWRAIVAVALDALLVGWFVHTGQFAWAAGWFTSSVCSRLVKGS